MNKEERVALHEAEMAMMRGAYQRKVQARKEQWWAEFNKPNSVEQPPIGVPQLLGEIALNQE